MEDTVLDQYVQRFQNIQPFNVYAVGADGSVTPWYEVTGAIVQDLVIRESALAVQVESIAAQLLHWGRLSAQAKRVWEIEERQYRVWKDRKILEAVRPPEDPKLAKEWKKPTESVIEATYRTHPDYGSVCQKVERAEEAYNATTAMVDALKAKRDMLKAAVVRAQESGQPRLSV